MDAGRANQGRTQQANRSQPAIDTGTATATATTTNVAPADSASNGTTSIAQVREQTPGEPAGPNQPALQSQAQTAQQLRGETLTDPREIFQHEMGLRQGLQEKFDALNPDQQKQFEALVMGQIPEGTEVSTAPKGSFMGMAIGGHGGGVGCATPANNGEPPSPEEIAARKEQMLANGTRNGLYGLLGQEKLTDTDSQGNTLMDNLQQLQTQDTAEGLDGNRLMQGTVAELSFTNNANNVPNGSWAASALQKQMADESPSEYARTVSDLASPSGEAQLGETKITRGSDAILGPDQVGNPSGNLFQKSVSETQARDQLFERQVNGNPESAARFEQLDATGQRQFREVFDSTIPAGNRPPPLDPSVDPHSQEGRDAFKTFADAQTRAQTTGEARTGLTNLLSEGTLEAKDKNGDTLLSNLHGMSTQEMATEGGQTLDRQQVLGEVISQIDDPGKIHQGNKGTCTVTTIEHLQAKHEPAEYARVMRGLTSAEGEVELRNGETLHRDHNLVADDQSGRTSASRVYQASLMEYGNGDQDYRNAPDGHFTQPGWLSSAEPIVDRDGDLRSGLPNTGMKRVSDAVLQGDYTIHDGPMRGQGDAWEGHLSGAVDDGKNVQVAMRWSRDDQKNKDSYHALSLYDMDDKYVYLRNPHGSSEMGNTDNPAMGPNREALRRETPQGGFGGFGGFPGFGMGMGGGSAPVTSDLPIGETGTLRMTREEFARNLDSYLIED